MSAFPASSAAMHPSARAALQPALEVVTAFAAASDPDDGDRELFWSQLHAVLAGAPADDESWPLAELLFGLVQLSGLLAADVAAAREEPIRQVLQQIGLEVQTH